MTKTVLVTGANRGIGLAIAKGLASADFNVLMGCRDVISGEHEARKIEGSVTAVELNLSDRETLADDLDTILVNFPRIDVLVNNAGVLDRGALVDLKSESFYSSMRVNFEAPYDLMRAIVPRMINQGYGRIVNISSGWGSFSDNLNGPGAYSVSKAALNALTLSFSHGLPKDIKINAMCPGWVRTEMGGASASKSPEEGAETAIWLANLSADGPNGGFFRDKSPIPW